VAETLPEIFFRSAERFADKGALVPKVKGIFKAITYRECAETVMSFACGLSELGVTKGDRVALLSENRPEWAFSDLAVLALGGITVPLYLTLSPKQIEYGLNDSQSKIAIISRPEHLEKFNAIIADVPYLEQVITFYEPSGSELYPVRSFDSVVARGKAFRKKNPHYIAECLKKVSEDDCATIIYTSGTTGEPRGVLLTHRNFISNINGALELIRIDETDMFLSFLPLCHVFERMAGYYLPLSRGSTIVYAESVQTVGDNMQEVHPTIMASVPRLYEKIYNHIQDKAVQGSFIKRKVFEWCINIGKKHYSAQKGRSVNPVLRYSYAIADRFIFKKVRERTGGRMKYFVSGGAPLSKHIGEFFAGAGLTVLEGYGLTETSPVISLNPPEDNRIGTVGKPLPGVEVRIAEDGEICVRGPNVMAGYHNKPDATNEAFDKDGWFHTGDIGSMSEDRYITITDRKKNLIITSGGKNIAPQPIENMLLNSPYILQIMMVAERRSFPGALVVPNFENLEIYCKKNGISYTSRKELINHPRAYELINNEIERLSVDLAHCEKIKKIVLLENEFTEQNGEITPTLKLKRKVIEEKYKKEIEKIYS